jgi:methyl-accepting chemotaxis protein
LFIIETIRGDFSMKYSDFRVKAILPVALIIFCSLLFFSAVDTVQSSLIWNVSQAWPLVTEALIKNCVAGIPLILTVCVFFYKYLEPIHVAFATLDAGASLPEATRKKAEFRLVKLQRRLMVGNYAVYGLTAIITVIQNGFTTITASDVLEVIVYLVMAIIAAMIEAGIILRIVSTPRKLLAIHSITEDTQHEMGLRNKLILTNLCLASFMMIVMFFTSASTIDRETLYNRYLTKIVSGELTLDEARDRFKDEGANALNVPKDLVVFPLDVEQGTHDSSRSLGGTVLLILVLLGIAYAVERISADETVREIKRMSARIREMLSGSGDLTKRIEITQYDEVGLLVSDVNALMEKIRLLFLDVRQTSRMTGESATNLAHEIADTSDVGEQLGASATQIARSVDASLAGIEASEKNLTQVFQSIDNIIASVDAQAAFVNQTSSSVAEMAANVKSVSEATTRANGLADQLSKAAADGNASVTDSIQAIRKVEESSKKVTEMVSVISQISSQTNLLAMNAAIEAAHAGDAGKGFAVVATEVRSLAESSAKSAKEINVQIKKMLETVNNGVALSERAGSALDSISQDIKATTDLVRQIADAMSEQSLASNEILVSITSLVDETQSIRNNAMEQKRRNDVVHGEVVSNTGNFREIAEATAAQRADGERILKSLADLRKIEAQNTELAKKLKELVEGFKLE